MTNRVQQYRLAKGLSYAALADRLECSETFVKMIESGKRLPSLGMAYLFSLELKQPVDEIFPPQYVWSRKAS